MSIPNRAKRSRRGLCASVAALAALAAVLIAPLSNTARAQTVQGVTDTEILIGTITDLSGVTAVQGVNSANAIRLAFDEACGLRSNRMRPRGTGARSRR